MSHFDYDEMDRGISEDVLQDHPAAVLTEGGHIADAISGELLV